MFIDHVVLAVADLDAALRDGGECVIGDEDDERDAPWRGAAIRMRVAARYVRVESPVGSGVRAGSVREAGWRRDGARVR